MEDPWCHDGIEITRLCLDAHHCIGSDAWGRQKEQPVLVSIRFAFKAGFDTAAETDSLDTSTVNYGQASKQIKAITPVKPWEPLDDFCSRIYRILLSCLSGPKTVDGCSIKVHLPKASLLGSEVTLSYSYRHLQGVAWPLLNRVLCITDIHVPTLVGINKNEREHKQPLLFSIWLSDVPAAAADTYVGVERQLFQIVESSCFETLESLALFAVHGLYKDFLVHKAPQSTVRLRIEKPMAVPSASAPSIEVVRTPSELSRLTLENVQSQGSQELKLVRPYAKVL